MFLELVPDEEEEIITKNQHSEVDQSQYSGLEQRIEHRRKNVDRREMLRFEEEFDRRKGSDRRGGVKLWKERNF